MIAFCQSGSSFLALMMIFEPISNFSAVFLQFHNANLRYRELLIITKSFRYPLCKNPNSAHPSDEKRWQKDEKRWTKNRNWLWIK